MSASGGEPPNTRPLDSLRASIVRGTMWMGGALWATRGLGLISAAILARILAPQDFGLVAMAAVVTGFLNVLFTFGIDVALIQNAEATRADWDTAWSVQVAQGAILAALVALLAPVVARFYDEPRVTPVMLVLAGGLLIASFENIGVVAFRKELQFDRAFRYAVAKKVFQISVTIPLALWLRNYWALLAGTVISQGFSSVYSYFVHPFRPRWSMARLRAILGFTSRMAFISLARYFTFEGERLIIGALTGARPTGLYAVSTEFAQMPTAELTGAFAQATFPGLVKLRHDRERLRAGYLGIFGFVALYALPAGIGIAILAPDLVPVLLGPQWTDAVPVFRIMAIGGALRAAYGPAYNLLVVFGRLDNALLVSWLQAGLQVALLVPVIDGFGLTGAAALNGALAAATLVFCIGQVARCIDISAREHLATLWRPLLAGAVMAVVCIAVSRQIATPLLSLLCTVPAGVAAYALAVLALWLLCGRPRGVEAHLVELARARLAIAQ